MESKSKDKNNAYILIYKKKGFNGSSIKNYSHNYKTKLALPPYNKMSNVNDEFINIINIEMFKYWTLENLFNPIYQNFIINLLKMDLARNLNKSSDSNHSELFKELKDENYFTNNTINNKNSFNIFEYGLRYFFNVILRTTLKEKEYREKFSEIIKCYIEYDINKAQYILEEFSDNDAINEYLVFCPVEDSINSCSEIIIISFKKDMKDKEKKDIMFLYKFINSFSGFIVMNYIDICIKYPIKIFFELINLDICFINYLKEKSFDVWLDSVIIA